MTSALGNLVFLSTLWLLVIAGAAVLEESGAKIAAALKGKSRAPQIAVQSKGRMRIRWPQPMRAKPQWRAAA